MEPLRTRSNEPQPFAQEPVQTQPDQLVPLLDDDLLGLDQLHRVPEELRQPLRPPW